MTNHTHKPDGAMDVGIALLHSDGSVSLPVVGRVETRLEGLACDRGMFDVEPGQIAVRLEDGATMTLAHQDGKWVHCANGPRTTDLAKSLARLAVACTGLLIGLAVVTVWVSCL